MPSRSRPDATATAVAVRIKPAEVALEIARRFTPADGNRADVGEFARQHIVACLPEEVRNSEREPTPGEEFFAFGAATRREAALAYLGAPLDVNMSSTIGRAELSRDQRQLTKVLEELESQVKILRRIQEVIDG